MTSSDIVSITEFCAKYKISKAAMKAFNLNNEVKVQPLSRELFIELSNELLSKQDQEKELGNLTFEILTSEDLRREDDGYENTLVPDRTTNIIQSSETELDDTTDIKILYSIESEVLVKCSSPPYS
ncbi:hypothetical protein RNJ44_02516 [Nakaseomyces bracarensis]|uniref:Uncharacterized protein n=1 Tax=Nakaseomyces bracarensis TaxID=273131 RepID=A0ABR4NLX2_9SACH